MCKNRLVVAAAGSGKTTYLVKEALKIKDKNVLITTFTEANEEEIRTKFIQDRGFIPSNVKIQTWFSFLLQHGVRPYQGILNDELHDRKLGFHLTEKPSGFRYVNSNGKPVYWGESDFFHYYFTKDFKIHSDKISKFIVACNKEMKGEIVGRISRIYPNIFVDEVQDLAGWELEILSLLFKAGSQILLVGDPRQVTYLTHHPRKHSKYKDGKIEQFIGEKCRDGVCYIDRCILNNTHRNNLYICDYSSRLFPIMNPCKPCVCKACRNYKVDHEGIFIVRENGVKEYCKEYNPVILREKSSVFPEWNFGKSKGLTFERVLIYPTIPIKKWMVDNTAELFPMSRCKFYVALTRAKYSVAIVYDYAGDEEIEGVKKYNGNLNGIR